MAIIAYNNSLEVTTDGALITEPTELVAEVHESNRHLKSLLTALGNFWTEVFTDYEMMETILVGVNTLLLTEYYKVLHLVLSGSIINIPTTSEEKFKLLTFAHSDATYVLDPLTEEVAYIEYPLSDKSGIDYLVTSLFSPKVALVGDGTHYEVVDEKIRFYVDIFNDQTILSEAYQISDSIGGTQESPTAKYILFWATNTYVISQNIQNRFSTFMYKDGVDNDHYKEVTKALQYFFTNTKSLPHFESAINILMGLPNSKVHGERVIDIYPVDINLDRVQVIENVDYTGYEESPLDFAGVDSIAVWTDHNNIYYVPVYADLVVNYGDILEEYQVLGKLYSADDYISNSNWYGTSRFPWELVVDCNWEDLILPIYCDVYPGIVQQLSIYGCFEYGDGHNYSDINDELFNLFRKTYKLLRPRQYSTNPLERRLYAIMDTFEKHNIVYVSGELTFTAYTLAAAQLINVFPYIDSGIPAYDYLMRDTVIKGVFKDDVLLDLEDDDFFISMKVKYAEYLHTFFDFPCYGCFSYGDGTEYTSDADILAMDMNDLAINIVERDVPAYKAVGDTSAYTYYDPGASSFENLIVYRAV